MRKMLILTIALALGGCQTRQNVERSRYGYGYGYPGGGYQQPYTQKPYWGRYGY